MRIDTGAVHLNCEIGGEGTALVLTHGLGGDLHFWDDHVETFAAHHRVVRWDVRGFGSSDKPAGPYAPADFARDLLGLLDALELRRVHLLGISMGGVITQRFALDFPDRLLSMILVSTSSEVGPAAVANWQRLADLVEQRGLDARTADASRGFSATFKAAHPAVVSGLTDRVRTCDPRSYAAAARAVADYHWTADLARVAVPTLILQGLEDQLTPPGGAVKLARALPYSRLVFVPEAGHYLPIEQTIAFRSAVLAFTAGIDLSAKTVAGISPV
jgi:3-oxoadipate enol-lactonase